MDFPFNYDFQSKIINEKRHLQKRHKIRLDYEHIGHNTVILSVAVDCIMHMYVRVFMSPKIKCKMSSQCVQLTFAFPLPWAY